MTADDDRLIERLAEGLAPEPRRPSDERVAAVRASAARWQDEHRPTAPVSLAGRRRPRREVLTGAVAVAVGAAFGAIGLEAADDDPVAEAPTEPVEVAVSGTGVEADAVLIDHTWGTEIILTATGLVPGRVYRTTVQPVDGSDDVPAGSFLGVNAVPVVCRMNASILRAAAASFTVVDDENVPVISGRFV